MRNYIVYQTTNKINGKIYVGIHVTDLSKKQTYIGCGVCKKDQKKKINKGFPAAVHKYGYDNFERKILYTYPETEDGLKSALRKEAEIVTPEFVKRKDTYNLVPGGEYGGAFSLRKQIAQYTLEGKFITVWDAIVIAEAELGLTSISQNLTGVSKYCGNYQWKYYNGDNSDIEPVQSKEKSVYQFDLQGNLIKRWKSITEASKQFNKPSSAKVSISRICLGKGGQAYGYYWSFKNKFEPKKNNHLSPVAKYNDAGEFLESYSSIKEAADSNNIKTPANIIAAIKGTQKRCGGFRWRYFYGNSSNIKPL